MNRYRDDILPVATLLLIGSLAFVHLSALPIFPDEARQLLWIRRILEAGDWLQPLGDGKPLEAWPMVPLVWLGLHPLMATRALHVLAGMIGAVLTYRLALRLSDRSSALVNGVLFAVCPFVVYLQRLALSDMFLCTAGIWVLINSIDLIEAPTWSHATWFAISLVLAAVGKLPVGFIFLISVPLALLLMPAPGRRRLLHGPGLLTVSIAHAPAVLLAAAVTLMAVIRTRHGQPPGFGLQDLLGIGLGHYRGIAAQMGVARPTLIGELTTQLSWPVTVIGCIGLGAAALLPDWRQRWLIAVGVIPMLVIALLSEFWFSRYLLFTLPPLIVGAVSGWQALALRAAQMRTTLQLGALAVCVGFMGRQDALIVLDPPAASWSPVDRFQYFAAPGSGYGYAEAAQYVLGSPAPPWMIYSLDGYSADQLLTYLPPSWRGKVNPVYYGAQGEVLRSDAERLQNLRRSAPAWIIAPEQLLHGDLQSNFGRSGPDRINLRQIAAFNKPGLQARLAIYEVERASR